jgi:hypothetical protein
MSAESVSMIHEQSERQRQLNEIVRGTERLRAAKKSGRLIRLSRGDAMAIRALSKSSRPLHPGIDL